MIENKAQRQNIKIKNETRLFFNYYRIKDFKPINFVEDGELYWEHSELTELKPNYSSSS
jgi:hypothetical protein